MDHHEKSDELESESSVDVQAARLHENSINPPFAAATPLMVGEDDAPLMGADDDVVVHVDSLMLSDEVPPMAFAEQDDQPQDPESFRSSPGPQSVVAEAVYFDEVSAAIQDQYDQGHNEHTLREQQEQQEIVKTRKSRAKALALICLCLFIGGVLGAVIGISRTAPEKAKISSEGEEVISMPTTPPPEPAVSEPTIPHPLTPPPTVSSAPSLSQVPSMAPSCVENYEPVSSLGISGEPFSNFEVSSDGSTAIMTHRQVGLFNQPEAFFFDTFDIETGSIFRNSLQHDLVDVHDMKLSKDGRRLVVGAFGFEDDNGDLGGAVLVYTRSGNEWLLRYVRPTGGGSYGSVFHVATDSAGFTFAAIVGVIGGDSPTFARVYRVSIGDLALRPMGQVIVDNSISDDAKVGLSANGRRLFLYTRDDRVRVYDYSLNEDMWEQLGEPITWGESFKIDQLQVSDDGKTFLLVTGVVGIKAYVMKQAAGGSWKSFPLELSDGIPTTVTGTFYYHFGDLSANGETVALSTSYYAHSNSIRAKHGFSVYQERRDGWRQVDFVELPYGGSYGGSFLGVGLDETGDTLIASGQETIETFAVVCSNNGPPTTQNPSSLQPSSATSEPSCPDSFALNASSNFMDGCGNLFPSEQIESPAYDTEQYVVSIDGSTVVMGALDASEDFSFLNTYRLMRVDDDTLEGTDIEKTLKSLAISGDGRTLAAGVGLVPLSVGFIPFSAGGSLLLFQDNGTTWDVIAEVVTGLGVDGFVLDVAICNTGTKIAILAGQSYGDYPAFISVYSLENDDILIQMGNSLRHDWVNENATIGIIEERLFVASTDGFIHTFDLGADSVWQNAGEPIPLGDAEMFLAATNMEIAATSSLFDGVQVFEHQGLLWNALDMTLLNDNISDNDVAGLTVSSDGREILVTIFATEAEGSPGPPYIAKLFQRVGDSYILIAEIELFHEGLMQTSQITESGDMVFVFDNDVATYTRIACESPQRR